MLISIKTVIAVVFHLYYSTTYSLSQFPRWCKIGENWSSFDPSTSVCFECREGTRLLSKQEAQSKVCCDDGSRQYLVTERTQCEDWPRNNVGIACNNGNLYLDNESCDGYNQCRDGSDERSCEVDCLSIFRCSISNRTQCYPTNKVCDGVKDCLEGTDEMNCIYHSGSCDGYRCTKFQECVDRSKICDGVKDCLDGTDEQGCILEIENLFFCSGSNVVAGTAGMDKVCNGSPDCPNELDETNCWTWSQWSVWSTCGCELISTQQRNRTCINAYQSETTGKCGNGTTIESQRCDCTQTGAPTTPSQQTEVQNASLQTEWIIVIALATLVLSLATVGMLYGAWYNKKAKEAMEKQVRTVANMYTQSAFSLSPPPVVPTHQQPRTFFPPSPHPTRPTGRRPDEPLPITPLQVINHCYESIEALHLREATIDPYAETQLRSPIDDSSEDSVTVVQTYQTSPGPLSGDEYVRTPPPVPEAQAGPVEKYGYLVASFSEKKHENIRADSLQGLTYAKMKKTTKRSRAGTPIKVVKSRIQSQKHYRTDDADEAYTTMKSASAHRANSTPATPVHFNSQSSTPTKATIRKVKSAHDFIEVDRNSYEEDHCKTEHQNDHPTETENDARIDGGDVIGVDDPSDMITKSSNGTESYDERNEKG